MNPNKSSQSATAHNDPNDGCISKTYLLEHLVTLCIIL